MNEIENAIRVAWEKNTPRRAKNSPAVLALATIIGVMAGWALHNYKWRADDLSFLVHRGILLTARCHNTSVSEEYRRLEARLKRPTELFRLEDKLIALDYLFDTLAMSRCTDRPHTT